MPKLGLWFVVLRGAVQGEAVQRPHVRCFIMPKLGLWFVVLRGALLREAWQCPHVRCFI